MTEDITGTIREIFPPETKNGFTKRDFILEVENEKNSNWNDFYKMQVTKDNIEKMDTFDVGDIVRCHCNIQGRKWNKPGTNETFYFTSFNVFGIGKADGSKADAGKRAGQAFTQPVVHEPVITGASEVDDLPF